MRFTCFRFCLLGSKLESVSLWRWRKRHHDTIQYPRNLKTTCYASRHLHRKCRYTELGCRSEEKIIITLMKTKYWVHIMVYRVVTSDWKHYASIHLPTWPHTQHGDLQQVAGGSSAILDRKGSWWKTLCLAIGLCALSRKQENIELAVRKYLRRHHPEHLAA